MIRATTSSVLKESKVAKYLTKVIDTKAIKQSELAYKIGYNKANIITMFKQGLTKLPINKVRVTAEALDVDPVHLMRLVLSEYQPDTLECIEEVYGYAVTDNEMKVIELMRNATDDRDPVVNSVASKELTKIFKTLV